MVGKHADYVNSRLYKIVFLLSGYRALMCNNASDVVLRIKKYRMSHNKPTGEMDMNFIILIDTGFEMLDEEEVRIYSDYVADFMQYDRKHFYDILYSLAGSTGNPDMMPDRTKIIAQGEAMHQVYRDMN